MSENYSKRYVTFKSSDANNDSHIDINNQLMYYITYFIHNILTTIVATMSQSLKASFLGFLPFLCQNIKHLLLTKFLSLLMCLKIKK